MSFLTAGCAPLDEVCAARALAESEGVSHGKFPHDLALQHACSWQNHCLPVMHCLVMLSACNVGRLHPLTPVTHAVEDPKTHVFYALMSNWVIFFIAFCALYLFSFTGTRRYQRRRDVSKSRLSSPGGQNRHEVRVSYTCASATPLCPPPRFLLSSLHSFLHRSLLSSSFLSSWGGRHSYLHFLC